MKRDIQKGDTVGFSQKMSNGQLRTVWAKVELGNDPSSIYLVYQLATNDLVWIHELAIHTWIRKGARCALPYQDWIDKERADWDGQYAHDLAVSAEYAA